MGRISTHVTIRNFADPSKEIRCDALVDTGATMLTLPLKRRDRLGDFPVSQKVEMEIATQQRVEVEVCGPVVIQLEGFRSVTGEVCFLEMNGEEGTVEPLVGYITLEQSGAAVDPLGHRLIRLP